MKKPSVPSKRSNNLDSDALARVTGGIAVKNFDKPYRGYISEPTPSQPPSN